MHCRHIALSAYCIVVIVSDAEDFDVDKGFVVWEGEDRELDLAVRGGRGGGREGGRRGQGTGPCCEEGGEEGGKEGIGNWTLL